MDCCSKVNEVKIENDGVCPNCNKKAKNVKLITLKSLLKPTASETLNANVNHYFCTSKECNVVYFDAANKKYLISDIKVAVHQKDDDVTTPICYCFNWTNENVEKYVKQELFPNPIEHINTRRDVSNNSGVERHCSECTYLWFEWQNRAVEREKEKWQEFNGGLVNNKKIPLSNFIK